MLVWIIFILLRFFSKYKKGKFTTYNDLQILGLPLLCLFAFIHSNIKIKVILLKSRPNRKSTHVLTQYPQPIVISVHNWITKTVNCCRKLWESSYSLILRSGLSIAEESLCYHSIFRFFMETLITPTCTYCNNTVTSFFVYPTVP